MIEILNRQAKFNYEILETIETGIVLTGTEIKSLKLGNANIKDSYATIRNNEVFLLNMHISHYEEGNIFNHDETRTRKLLLHKKEILKLKKTLINWSQEIINSFTFSNILLILFFFSIFFF